MRKIDDKDVGSKEKFKAIVQKAKDNNIFIILGIFLVAVLIFNLL